MIQRHRVYTEVGKDQKVTVELNQNFDLLEVLSLKLTQKDVYTSLCADYGVVCGRVIVNDGFGVPNARVSIFVPLSSDDENDPVISALYPYKTINDIPDSNYRYNLLPARQQHGGHEPVGTFPDQSDILNREEVLEVYEKYYKYTAKTNDSGDFMIWGVPLGEQSLHVDLDLSDIGCFSLRPYDLIRLGKGVDEFKNQYQFKSSPDLDALPQIKTFNKPIEVYPFWGNEDLCEIGITRADFNLSDKGVRIEPKAYLIGGAFVDENKNAVDDRCQSKSNSGQKCGLRTKHGKVETIRFTSKKDDSNRPILEEFKIDEDIDDDGSFLIPIPMNMDYVFTNEFGDMEYTNDPNKGIATAGCYRLRMSLGDEGDGIQGNYLLPNIREYIGTTDLDKSYAFSTSYDDYPSHAVSNYITHVDGDGFHVPQDYFYRFSYNKVFTVSSFQSSYFKADYTSTVVRDRFVGLKQLVPQKEKDCTGEKNTPPVNFAFKNFDFTLLITTILLFFEQLSNIGTGFFYNSLARTFHRFADAVDFWPIRSLSNAIRGYAYDIQNNGQRRYYLISYPDCEECNQADDYGQLISSSTTFSCQVGTMTIAGSSNQSNRNLGVSNVVWSTSPSGCTTNITSNSGFTSAQNSYVLKNNSTNTYTSINTSGNEYFTISGTTLTFVDSGGFFASDESISVTVYLSSSGDNLQEIETGCSSYDTPYDESIVRYYYYNNGNSYDLTPQPGRNYERTNLSESGYKVLPATYNGDTFTRLTKTGESEFQNGVFTIVPGAQSNTRIYNILKEYRRRKRVTQLFCGGQVNYGFIDNWLSGSLYFFQFTTRFRDRLKESAIRYCRDLVRYVEGQDRFYYRSSKFNKDTGAFGDTYSRNWFFLTNYGGTKRRLNRPTTFVDLGPRDEFIKEICIDPKMDPNCSISRTIGSTSYNDFGDILGLAINYRLDVSDNTFDIDGFFQNRGFIQIGASAVLSGDLLQLMSINCETGIEPFDLLNPKYVGFNYTYLDPELYPSVFKKNGQFGPLPITMYLNADGERIRSCLNEPGRLTESAQPVPFYLWDKKDTGFGSTLSYQAWDYENGVVVQPLQGMTYGYSYPSAPNDPTDKYLLLPITNTFSGLTLSVNVFTGATEFNVVIANTDNHRNYDSQYPGFTVLKSDSAEIEDPSSGTIYARVGPVSGNTTFQGVSVVNGWVAQSWDNTKDFVIRPTTDYYSGNKQILSTPFHFYFGLKHGKTGLDKLIKHFGPKGAFPTID